MLRSFEDALTKKLDLERWSRGDAAERRAMLTELFDYASAKLSLPMGLLFEKPEGVDASFALADPMTGDIHINESRWRTGDPVDPLFYFLKELRRAAQSARPELFPPEIALNDRYVIQFDGTCYRVEDEWVSLVKLEGSEDYFTELFLASPCQTDANDFALRCLKNAGAGRRADELHAMWAPGYHLFPKEKAREEFMNAVRAIDRLLSEEEPQEKS